MQRLKTDFAKEVERDPAQFKKQALRIIRAALPLKRGRPRDPQIEAAVRMIADGNSLKDVLRSQLPNFDRLDTYGRYLAEKGLRSAIARRRQD